MPANAFALLGFFVAVALAAAFGAGFVQRAVVLACARRAHEVPTP